ncbi:MAG: lipopolysaccharide biosynthesis protein [Pseudanabaenaceae cyanobacterium bins.39]|nr:lipopolysaccharide biosynthesis protein [Pseudanabaenaceae cyanobacterium bins.39]
MQQIKQLVQPIINSIQQKLTNRFVRNIGWLGLSEVFIRISRLAATVILARWLSEYDYGLAALVLTTNEFVNVFTRNGIFDKLIQAKEEDIEELSQTAYYINWFICGGLFLIQCLVALPMAWIYKDSQVILPICVMGVVYLMLPMGLIQAARSQRENRLHVSALANALQISTDNILTMILAWQGFGMWAIVLPKVIVAPIWVIVHRSHNPWRSSQSFTLHRWQEIIQFGRNILGIQMLATLRNNLDYLIAGHFLGIKALGLYYFAFNAGLGISLSFITAVDAALYPHLCEARSDPEQFRDRYLQSFPSITKVIIPIVSAQTLLAPFYVPLIFGQKWIPAIPLLILICLSAIPRPYANAASKALWAMDKPSWDLLWNILFTVLFAIAIAIGTAWQIIGVAAAVMLIHWGAVPLFVLGVKNHIKNYSH